MITTNIGIGVMMDRREMIEQFLEQVESELDELTNSQLENLVETFEHHSILDSIVDNLDDLDEDADDEGEEELSFIDGED